MENEDLCILSHKYTTIYKLPIFLGFPDPYSYLQHIPVALLGLWIRSFINGGKCECSYLVFLFDSYMKLLVTLRSLISSRLFFGLSERRTCTHADEHSVQGSSPLTLGIRGDFLSMYRDYTLNVLYICSKSYIVAYILWSREMAISKARLNNFIPVFQWGEKFHLIAK